MRSSIQIVLISGWLTVAGAYSQSRPDAGAALRREVTALAKRLGQAEKVHVGTVAGYPYLGNGSVILVWDKPGSGAGLVSMYDVTAGKELLSVNPGKAPLWKVFVKSPMNGTLRSWLSPGSHTANPAVHFITSLAPPLAASSKMLSLCRLRSPLLPYHPSFHRKHA